MKITNKRKILYSAVFIVAVIITGFLFSLFMVSTPQVFYVAQEKLSPPALPPTPLPTPLPTSLTGVEKGAPLLETTNRLMIYTASMSLEVKNLTVAVKQITSLTKEFNGFVQNIKVYGTERKKGYVTVRVPQGKFQQFLEEISGIGKVKGKEVKGEDVTEKFIDLQARLNNSKREEQRLLQILEVAKTVDEILKVENELKRVRTEIDTLTGQIKFLQRRINYSTVEISLEEPPVQPPWLQIPQVDWSYPLELGLTILLNLIQAMISITIAIGPIAVPGFLIYKSYKKRKQGRKQPSQSS